jgi:hypothetical protein
MLSAERARGKQAEHSRRENIRAIVPLMPTATQLNLSMDNKIGTLARLCRDLAHGGVNLLAISAPEAGQEKGVVRLLVPNRELATHVLSGAGYAFAEDVLFVELTNRPGALAKAVEKLAKAGIDIRYAYATASRRTRTTAAVISVSEGSLSRALQLLG